MTVITLISECCRLSKDFHYRQQESQQTDNTDIQCAGSRQAMAAMTHNKLGNRLIIKITIDKLSTNSLNSTQEKIQSMD